MIDRKKKWRKRSKRTQRHRQGTESGNFRQKILRANIAHETLPVSSSDEHFIFALGRGLQDDSSCLLRIQHDIHNKQLR